MNAVCTEQGSWPSAFRLTQRWRQAKSIAQIRLQAVGKKLTIDITQNITVCTMAKQSHWQKSDRYDEPWSSR